MTDLAPQAPQWGVGRKPISAERIAQIKAARKAATTKGGDELKRITRDWFLAAWQDWDSMRDPASMEALVGTWRMMRGR